MPVCRSRFSGEIEYSQDSILQFPRGLFGFEDEQQFLAIEHPSVRPIVFLQSLATPGLCFISLPVLVAAPGYRLVVPPEDLPVLGLADQPEIGKDVLCLTILTIPEGGAATANLLAPVVVNVKSLVALQTISTEPGYSHQHPLAISEETCACL